MDFPSREFEEYVTAISAKGEDLAEKREAFEDAFRRNSNRWLDKEALKVVSKKTGRSIQGM